MVEYAKILKSKIDCFTGNIFNYLTEDGYTKKSGCPTNFKVQIEGSNKWYRVYNFCISNTGTLFIKTKDNPYLVVNSLDLEPKLESKDV